MKLQWLLRDHGHSYYKGPPLKEQKHHRSMRGTGEQYVYRCAHCMSWMRATLWEMTPYRPVGFCPRSQGMLFDKTFRTEKIKS